MSASFRALETAGIELDRSEWWEVPNSSDLAKKLRRSYPEFEPVTDPTNGELTDIIEHRSMARQETMRARTERKEALRRELKENARARGYSQKYRKTTVQEKSMEYLRDVLQKRAADSGQ